MVNQSIEAIEKIMASGTINYYPEIQVLSYTGTTGNYGECYNIIPSGLIVAVKVKKVGNALNPTNTVPIPYSYAGSLRSVVFLDMTSWTKFASGIAVEADIYYIDG